MFILDQPVPAKPTSAAPMEAGTAMWWVSMAVIFMRASGWFEGGSKEGRQIHHGGTEGTEKARR